MRRAVVSEKAPKAVGPYSSAVWEGDLLFLSGQTPIDPATQRACLKSLVLTKTLS